MIRGSISLVFAIAVAAGEQPALAEWQCLSAGATIPAAAQTASNYLGRAESIYSEKLLGVLRAGDRVYLVNARDDGWSERVRIGLMELRLAEPEITATRRFEAALSGGPAPEASQIPAGEFVCLARERAARQGLEFRGEAILLAAGKTVHLVDPIELAIAVEVRAVGSEPLDLREIFAASARAGIYAGLYRGRAQPGITVAARFPEYTIHFPVGPIGRPDGEVVITPRTVEGSKVEEKVAATGATDVLSVQAPAAVPAVPAPPVAEAPPARVVQADVPAAPIPVKPLLREASTAVVVAAAEPVSIMASVGAPATQGTRPVAGQSYEKYAKTMQTLMALRRSGAVRSISELTYVHPAVEDLRVRR